MTTIFTTKTCSFVSNRNLDQDLYINNATSISFLPTMYDTGSLNAMIKSIKKVVIGVCKKCEISNV